MKWVRLNESSIGEGLEWEPSHLGATVMRERNHSVGIRWGKFLVLLIEVSFLVILMFSNTNNPPILFNQLSPSFQFHCYLPGVSI